MKTTDYSQPLKGNFNVAAITAHTKRLLKELSDAEGDSSDVTINVHFVETDEVMRIPFKKGSDYQYMVFETLKKRVANSNAFEPQPGETVQGFPIHIKVGFMWTD